MPASVAVLTARVAIVRACTRAETIQQLLGLLRDDLAALPGLVEEKARVAEFAAHLDHLRGTVQDTWPRG